MKIKDSLLRLLIPAILVVLNLIIKGIFITTNSIAGDEPFSIYHAQMDIMSMINLLSTGNNPPLYEIILHFWIDVFGISPLSVRFPSLIFSCFTVFFIYKIGIRHFNRRVGIYSGLFFIFSNYQILFSHESRAYALIGMLTSISMFYFLELIEKKNIKNKSYFAGLLLSNIALIYTHYFGFFILIIQFLFIFLNRELRLKYWKQLLMGIGIIALFYLPNIDVIINRFIDSSANGTWVSPPNKSSLYNMLISFSNAPVVASISILIMLISTIKFFIKIRTSKITVPGKLVSVWFLFSFFFMFFISFKIPMFLDRYLMFVSIGFYILLAMASDYLIRTRQFKYILPVVLCIMFIYTTKPNASNNRNTKETIEKIITLKTDHTIIYFCPPWFDYNFLYYYDINSFKDYDTDKQKHKMHSLLHKDNIFPIYNKNGINEDLIKQAEKVIYLDAGADFGIPNNDVINKIEEYCTLTETYKFHQIFNIYEYELR